MKRSITMMLILGAAVTGVSQSAIAHEWSQRQYDPPRHHKVVVHRDHRMPGWLHRNRDFRNWYRRSALRHNDALAWWHLYEIFGWERRYHRHHYRPAHYASRDYAWYRDYWRKQDRRYHYDRDRRNRDDRADVRKRSRDHHSH